MCFVTWSRLCGGPSAEVEDIVVRNFRDFMVVESKELEAFVRVMVTGPPNKAAPA